MPKILKTESIFESKLFKINKSFIQFNSQVLEYEIICGAGNGAVMILPFINDEIILIKEYAASVDNYMITFPKGKIDKNESILDAANRELQEEVGLKAENLKLIKEVHLAPGYINHTTHIVIAKDLHKSKLKGDEPDDLEVVRIKYKDIVKYLEKEEVVDSRVFSALFIYERYEKE